MIKTKFRVGLLTVAAVCLPGLSGAHDKCDSLANATTAGGVFWAPIAGFQVGYYLAKAVDEATSSNTSADSQYDFSNCSLDQAFTKEDYQRVLEVAGQERGDPNNQMYPLWESGMQLHSLSYNFNQRVAAWQSAREAVRDARLEGDEEGAQEAREQQNLAHALAIDAFELYENHHKSLAQIAGRLADSLPANKDIGAPEQLLTVKDVEEAATTWLNRGLPLFEQEAFRIRCLNEAGLEAALGPARRFVDQNDDIPSDAFINEDILRTPTSLYEEIAATFDEDVIDNLPKNALPPGFALNEPIRLPQDIDVVADMTVRKVNVPEWVERHNLVEGTNSQVEFMLDRQTQVMERLQDRIIFWDPWQWHWIVGRPWDWLWGFRIEVIPRFPNPGPGPELVDRLRIVVPVDQLEGEQRDMVMGLEKGSRFVMDLNYQLGTLGETLETEVLPSAETLRGKLLSDQQLPVGQFQILDPSGALLLAADINSLDTNPIHFPVQTVGTIDWVEPEFGKATHLISEDGQITQEPSITAFMIDPRLTAELSPIGPVLIDPWWWHWIIGRNPWDWLRGFVVIIERVPEWPFPPGPGPWDRIRIITEFDDPTIDMVMGDALQVGSRFETQLFFRPGGALSEFALTNRLPPQEIFAKALQQDFETGSFEVYQAEAKEPVVRGTVDKVMLEAVDSDRDGVSDFDDNCATAKNLDQRDTNQDGYGNLCDGDLVGNAGIVNTLDLGKFKEAFGTVRKFPDADFNGDGVVNTLDLGLFKSFFGKEPGPSAVGMLHETKD